MAKYKILSPDGIEIERDVPHYCSVVKAQHAISEWLERYKMQGYYSTTRNGNRIRIPFSEIEQWCRVIKY